MTVKTCICNTTDWCECWNESSPCNGCRNRGCERHRDDEYRHLNAICGCTESTMCKVAQREEAEYQAYKDSFAARHDGLDLDDLPF